MNISDKLIITFDKKDGDIPTLLVAREHYDTMWETTLEVINEFTGDDAVAVYNFLKDEKSKDLVYLIS